MLASALIVAGCGTLSSAPGPGSASDSRPAAPRYNLTGYSAAFKQGYADACATPRRRNSERIKSDGDYSMGWSDGSSACRSR
jgi:hypothetical protein